MKAFDRFQLRSLLVTAAMAAFQMASHAAQLDAVPDTLKEASLAKRRAFDRPWDPSKGLIGNTRLLRIHAPGCTVRIVSGSENRILGGSVTPRIDLDKTEQDEANETPVHDVQVRVAGPAKPGTACLTIENATADDMILSGDGAAFMFDGTSNPSLRIALNPSAALKVWFEGLDAGHLSVSSNAGANVGGLGKTKWLTLGSNQSSTSMLFHRVESDHIGVSALTIKSRFSIKIGAKTKAGYYQPARAPGEMSKLYPIWIDGRLEKLEVPAGQVNPMAINQEITSSAEIIRSEVLDRIGSLVMLPPPDPRSFAKPKNQGPSIRQQFADGFEGGLLPGMSLKEVQPLRLREAALEGEAPSAEVVQQYVSKLNQAPDVTYAQVGYTKPTKDGSGVWYRVLATINCDKPGSISYCPAAVVGKAYMPADIRKAIDPLLEPWIMIDSVKVENGLVEVQGRGPDAAVNRSLAAIKDKVRWLVPSVNGVGKGSFQASFKLLCKTPPIGTGVCAAQQPNSR